MKKQVSITKAVKYVINSTDEKHTLLGIGPMSENFLRASLEISKEKDFPLMYIASRNQVDAYKFGGGYVFHADQKKFRDKIEAICEEIGYDNAYYLCRDHGGPWQRDKERNDHLPEAEAMEIAKESYKEDILNGFDLLHIDPTKDPDEMCKIVDIDVVFNRTIELIEYCEQVRKEYGIEKEIAYEVGTEETLAPKDAGTTVEAEEVVTPAPQKVKVNVFYNFDKMKDIAGFLGDINGTPLEVAEGSTNEQVKAAVKNQVDAKKEELSKRGYTFKEDYVYQANGKDYNYVVTFSKAAK